MGRPYARELEQLGETYAWAHAFDIGPLSQAIDRASHLPLVAVGSGGSLTTATLMAQLHRRYASSLATTTTPLQLTTSVPHGSDAAVWLLSARGRNEDIRMAFQHAVALEPRYLGVLCGRLESPLLDEAAEHSWVSAVAVPLPAKDGFLATNSALAFAVLLARAYAQTARGRLQPPSLGALLDASLVDHESLLRRCESLWKRSTLVVLHGASTAAAAIDLESRFTEAALGVTQIADYRNFAHGRHHWLAKHASSTAVLVMHGPEDAALSRATVRSIPDDVPVVEIEFAGTYEEILISSLVAVIRIAGAAGLARGIDPGKPGVPDFGRRLYHMKTPSTVAADAAPAPIMRKLKCGAIAISDERVMETWTKACSNFVRRLNGASFAGLVCDYDGTLIEGPDRDAPPIEEVIDILKRLLAAGIVIGIATGRGDSVQTALRSVLPRKAWPNVIVGYHNGGVVQPLSEDAALEGTPPSDLVRADEVLRAECELRGMAKPRLRRSQVTVQGLRSITEEQLWVLVSNVLRREGLNDLRVVRSSHSVDVIAKTSSKLNVLSAVQQRVVGDVLAIGDRGCWPGNDYELLSSPLSLSVDEVSSDPEGAWNVAPPGARGIEALLSYLSVAKIGKRSFRLALKDRM